MTRTRRALATLGSFGVALLLVSCGVDAGDAAQAPTKDGGTSSTSPTATTAPKGSEEPSKELTPQQQQLADTMAQAYEDLGFTKDEAACLSEGMAGSIDGTEPDISAMMDVVNQCDIPMDRLMEIQGGMGDGTPDGAFRESLATGMEASGLSEKDAKCVADGLVDEYGMDMEAIVDPTNFGPIAEDCGVDPSSVRPGG
jgi:hypothetical protein